MTTKYNNSDEGKKKPMSTYAFKLPPAMLEEAKRKAGLVALGRIIRILVAKWLRGEIQISNEDKEF
jgi:hypothetical protein